ncbi:SusC/RagA family TonB-linked outer membrane protein [Flavobacterium sp. Root901]|uniref:SusC/RagA family TonB-linked outer membrane protein n=1 Tax=Flavobacterium sp. Root901 TaxID=1736605 RepID=UPI0007100040|nr:TonB-dependent receptor [Flavobacterium sp. Root901]KRD12383.1 SusC/RagA family TonB-linked outer membrane protein [Flavobacterium sp. Root901]
MTNYFVASRSKYLKCFGFLILMFLLSSHLSAQITVTGTVSDANGPIPGANINLKGTKNGVSTSFDGNYSINVPSNSVLIFSFIGFKNKEVPVNGQTKINVLLEEDLNTLKEVVVIGYGTQIKEAVTGSVASLGGKELNEVASANITQALQGRLPGVELTQTSSKPGAAMQIRIRGTRSLTGSNDPLVVLDGVPFAGSIGDINPTDIKSVDILKDASATAIYGSRGANGVILVTTLKGRKNQKATFSYNGFSGIKQVFGKYPMMDAAKFGALRDYTGLYVDGVGESRDVNTDWQDSLYGAGEMISHDVSVSGGTEMGAYNAGLGYYKEESVLPGQSYERFSLRAGLDQQINRSIRLGFNTNSNYTVSNGDNIGTGTILATSPLANPYNADGSLRRIVSMAADDQWVYTRKSIENLGDAYVNQTRGFSSYNNIFAEVKIPGIDGLKYRLNTGLNFRTSNSGYYEGQGVFDVNPATLSNASISNFWSTQWLLENLLTYDKTFAQKHTINFVGLYSNEQYTGNSSRISRNGITSDAFQFYNLGQSEEEAVINPADQDYTQWGLTSYMARLMYSYDNRYFISGTVRSDGSSRLSPNNRWVTYPAVSAGWTISNESFLKDVKYINLLKLRAGYGETSNQAVAPYATLGALSTRPYNFGSTNSTGVYVTELPNPDLGWEFSTTWNYGLDFGFFNNRLSGTIEYYKTNTKDLLQRVGLPATSGVSGYVANVGETENKGYEISLNGVIFDNPKGLTWTVGVNFYKNENKLTALASGASRDEANNWFVGYNINSIYDYQKVGIWQEGDPYMSILEPGPTGINQQGTVVGSIKVKYTGEYNADGSPKRAINASDRQIIETDPDFQGGFNTNLTYKGFDFSAVGAFKSGGVLISTLYGGASYLNLMNGRRSNVDVDYWTPDNRDAEFPNPRGIRSGDNPKYISTMGYFDASYVKIRALTLGYTLDKDFTRNIGIDNLRLYVTAQNPFVLFSPYHDKSGMDPETNSFGDENQAVASYQRRFLVIGTNTPSTRNYLFGLNLTF